MFALILLEVLIVLNISYCIKQRKFYKENSTEMTGTVLSWEKVRRADDQMHPVHYLLTVQTAGGTYTIDSTGRKARRYHEGKEVTLLVVEHEPFEGLPEEALEKLTPEQLEKYQQALAAVSRVDEMEKKLTILKDDLKRVGEIVFCAVAGVFFGILLVAMIVDRFQ